MDLFLSCSLPGYVVVAIHHLDPSSHVHVNRWSRRSSWHRAATQHSLEDIQLWPPIFLSSWCRLCRLRCCLRRLSWLSCLRRQCCLLLGPLRLLLLWMILRRCPSLHQLNCSVAWPLRSRRRRTRAAIPVIEGKRSPAQDIWRLSVSKLVSVRSIVLCRTRFCRLGHSVLTSNDGSANLW